MVGKLFYDDTIREEGIAKSGWIVLEVETTQLQLCNDSNGKDEGRTIDIFFYDNTCWKKGIVENDETSPIVL